MGGNQAWRVLHAHGFRPKPEPPAAHSGNTWYLSYLHDRYRGHVLVLYCTSCEDAGRDEDRCVREWYVADEATKTWTEDPDVFRQAYRRKDR